MNKPLLQLYIVGLTPRSERAITNLRQICEEELGNHYEMVIIGVLERPQLAEDERILVTPTLVKAAPLPSRRVVGDLSDTKKVLSELDLLSSIKPES
jgi:circadian clock protein KaiB